MVNAVEPQAEFTVQEMPWDGETCRVDVKSCARWQERFCRQRGWSSECRQLRAGFEVPCHLRSANETCDKV